MSMALCHILPEADAMYDEYLEAKEAEEEGEHHGEEEEGEHHDEGHGFPFCYALFIVGFLIMLVLDKVLFSSAEIKVEESVQ